MSTPTLSTGHLLVGMALLVFTTTAWGAMFPVAKAALTNLDGFWVTLLRYGIAAPIFLAILALTEGRKSLSLEGKAWPLLVLGTLGFAGFSILVFVGLSHSRPEHGAIIMALMPMITALVGWASKGTQPASITLGCIACALGGVVLVVTKGDLANLGAGALGWDIMILAGAVCWVLYTIGAQRFPTWSPVRYTSLSCGLGALAIAAITIAATLLGASVAPTTTQIFSIWPELLYLIVVAGVMAVFSWNIGVKRLGSLNGVLFINLVPVTAFIIGALRGHSFTSIELIGAALTIAALVANNLAARRTSSLPLQTTPAK